MIDYKTPGIWNTIWARPYSNYEKHHQVFWQKIRKSARGAILDLACGSSSCWIGYRGALYGVDFSKEAIKQSRINYPDGTFQVATLPCRLWAGKKFDTLVACGLVNYYEDLTGLTAMLKTQSKLTSLIIITINVIDDFPTRHWDHERIIKEFGSLGLLEAEFIEKIGWFIRIFV